MSLHRGRRTGALSVVLAVVLILVGCSSSSGRGEPITWEALEQLDVLEIAGESVPRDRVPRPSISLVPEAERLGCPWPPDQSVLSARFESDHVFMIVYLFPDLDSADAAMASARTWTCDLETEQTSVLGQDLYPVPWVARHTLYQLLDDYAVEFDALRVQVENAVVDIRGLDDWGYVDLAIEVDSLLRSVLDLPPDPDQPRYQGEAVDGFTDGDSGTLCEYYTDPFQVSCTLFDNAWPLVAAPAGIPCHETNWNRTITLRDEGPAGMSCPNMGEGPTGWDPLPVGAQRVFGKVVCTNQGERVIVCQDQESDHGFRVSTTEYEHW